MKLPVVISLRNALPICAMPKGGPSPGGGDDVGEVDEYALGRLRAQVDGVLVGPDRAHVGLEHEVEHAGWRELAGALGADGVGSGVGTWGLGSGLRRNDGGSDFVLRRNDGGSDFVLRRNDGGKLVLAPAAVADDALDERVGEALDVAAGPPDLRVHDDGRVEADHVVALEDHGAPPGVLDVALELGAERAVVPGAGQASVNLAALEDEASALAEGYELVQVDGHALLRGGLCGEIIASAPTAPVGRKAEGTETPSPRPPPVKGEGIHSRRPGYPPAETFA